MILPPKKNRRTKGSSSVDRHLTSKEQKAMDWYNARRDPKEIPMMLDRSDVDKRVWRKS